MGLAFLPVPPVWWPLPALGGFGCPAHPGGITWWQSPRAPGLLIGHCADHAMGLIRPALVRIFG